jgi:hypothetical protein
MNEIETLYNAHAVDSPAVDHWIDGNYADIDAVRAFGPIAEMPGEFAPANISHIYQYKFTPDMNGAYRAVVMPVMEHGQMVDIVAFRQNANRKKLDVWGTVTGAGRFLNRDAIYDKSRTQPLVVCQSWWHWLRTGCKGVLPLLVKAIPELRDAGDVVVADPSHARQLLFEAYLWPTKADPTGPVWKAAREKGRRQIWVDDARAAA